MNRDDARRLLGSERTVMAFLALLSFSVYMTTMTPGVSFIDSGELAAVAATLGVAHPTGYPLFTILARAIVMIPAGSEEIWRLNVFAAVLVAVAVGIFYRVVLLMANMYRGKSKGKDVSTESHIGAAIGAAVLAFSSTVWAQSVTIEVYSLHLVLIVASLYTFLRGIHETRGEERLSRWLLLSSFCIGTSFANHMTTLLLAPAFLYLFFSEFRFRRSTWITGFKLAPFFLLGLSWYGYLPVRSLSGPLLNWGDPSSLERIIWHVSGKQYRSWIFSSFESAEKQLSLFVRNFPSEFHWTAIVVLWIGLWVLFWERRRLFYFVSLLVTGCLAYAVNYDIHDIESYFLLAYVGLGFFVAFGIERIGSFLLTRYNVRWLVVALLLLPVIQWWSNRTAVDQSDNTLVSDYTHNILNHLEPNAVVLTYQWDYFVSASYYYRHVRQERRDIIVVEKELLRRSWYFRQLDRNYPGLLDRSRQKVDAFLAELWKFEHGEPYNGRVIEAAFNAMINDLIDKSMESYPVYVGAEIEPQFAASYERVPDGLLFRLRKPGEETGLRDFSFHFRGTRYRSDLERGLKLQYAKMFTFRSIWLRNHGRTEEAREWLEKIGEISPELRPSEGAMHDFLRQ